MQKVNTTKKTIQLPFDGTAKCCDEVAKMISEALLKTVEEIVEIHFPVQWEMSPATIFHPSAGVIKHLSMDSDTKAAYKFTCFARNGSTGVTATRSC